MGEGDEQQVCPSGATELPLVLVVDVQVIDSVEDIVEVEPPPSTSLLYDEVCADAGAECSAENVVLELECVDCDVMGEPLTNQHDVQSGDRGCYVGSGGQQVHTTVPSLQVGGELSGGHGSCGAVGQVERREQVRREKVGSSEIDITKVKAKRKKRRKKSAQKNLLTQYFKKVATEHEDNNDSVSVIANQSRQNLESEKFKVIVESYDNVDNEYVATEDENYLSSIDINVLGEEGKKVNSDDQSNETELKNISKTAKVKAFPLFTTTKVLKKGGPDGSLKKKPEVNSKGKKKVKKKKSSIKGQNLITQFKIFQVSSSTCFSHSSDSLHKRPPEAADM